METKASSEGCAAAVSARIWPAAALLEIFVKASMRELMDHDFDCHSVVTACPLLVGQSQKAIHAEHSA